MLNMRYDIILSSNLKSEMREGVEKVIYVVMMGVRAQVRDENEMVIFDDQPISLFIYQIQICKMAGYYLSRACVIATRLIG